MIRFATGSDRGRLKRLWGDIFGDTPEMVEAYFAHRHRDENMLVETQGDDIAGMLTMLPLRLATPGKSFPARYIYAVATDTRYRNLGVSTRLLEHAHTFMQGRGEAAAILVPASPSLFDFYGKRGYKTAFSLDTVRFEDKNLPPFPSDGYFKPCTPGEYAGIRDKAFSSSRLYACWDENSVAYAVMSFGPEGGVTRLSSGNGGGCAAWERQDDAVLIRELALVNMDVPTALSVLHKMLNAKAYQVRLPESSLPGANTLPFGMIRWLIPEPNLFGKPPYLSLALD
jgi:GNAT superfamily N-acetyltransferase